MNAYNSDWNKITENRTLLSNDTSPTAREKELLAVEIDSGRSAILIPKLSKPKH